MDTLSNEFDTLVGYSDHTLGMAVSIAAAALGACVIEKHFTLDKSMDGPDHKASLSPEELKDLVNQIRAVDTALGSGEKIPAESERDVMMVARKSIVAGREIPKNATITREMLAFKRPGTGLPPSSIDAVVGRKARTDIKKDELLTLDMIIIDGDG
jgi:sialic acid synthase SpsE